MKFLFPLMPRHLQLIERNIIQRDPGTGYFFREGEECAEMASQQDPHRDRDQEQRCPDCGKRSGILLVESDGRADVVAIIPSVTLLGRINDMIPANRLPAGEPAGIGERVGIREAVVTLLARLQDAVPAFLQTADSTAAISVCGIAVIALFPRFQDFVAAGREPAGIRAIVVIDLIAVIALLLALHQSIAA